MRDWNDLDDVEVNRERDHIKRLVVCLVYVVGAYGGREVLRHEHAAGGSMFATRIESNRLHYPARRGKRRSFMNVKVELNKSSLPH
jgi:hypothetical protein